MATTDAELAALKVGLADVDCATAVNAIINSGTHAALSDRDANIIRRTFGVNSGMDFLNALQNGTVTIKDSTANEIKLRLGSVALANSLVPKINAIT